MSSEESVKSKYGLYFERKPEACEQILEDHIPLFTEIAPLKIGSKSSNNPHNPHLLIEGENLHVLMALQQTHRELIDVIYIDPPYNTGNKDFTYNDKFVDKEDGYRHSKWLSFMEKRLRLAKELLKDTGVIFISIDENEQANLKLLCDQIFRESNYVETFVWVKNSSKNNSSTTGCVHEYVVCYSKNMGYLRNNGFFRLKKEGLDEVNALYSKLKSNGVPNPEIEKALRIFYKENPQLKGISAYKFVDNAGIFTSDNASAPGGNGATYPVYHPNGYLCPAPSRGWGWTEGTFKANLENNLILFGKDHTTIPRFKRYLSTVETEVAKSIIVDNTDGKKELQSLFKGYSPFSCPTPTTLMCHLLKMMPKSSIVLDFFAGSGTMGHATMALNAEDGGSRQCILVTNNEGEFQDPATGAILVGGIFDNVTYPRIKKVSEGYITAKGKQVNGLNQSAKVFKVTKDAGSFVNPAEYTPKSLIQAAIPTFMIKEGLHGLSEVASASCATLKVFEQILNGVSCYLLIAFTDIEDSKLELFIDNHLEQETDTLFIVYRLKEDDDIEYLDDKYASTPAIKFRDMPE